MHHQQDSNRGGYVLAKGTMQKLKLFKDCMYIKKNSENHTLVLPLYRLYELHIFQRIYIHKAMYVL